MTLKAIGLRIDLDVGDISESERELIAAGEMRIRSLLVRKPDVTTLLASDPQAFCRGLKALRRQGILKGRYFCDWGSGIGLISGLAALNGFEAYGVEVEAAFVAEADALCSSFSLTASFVRGSFVPSDISGCFGVLGTYGATDWSITRELDVYDALGRNCAAMDLIYAYPWPREVHLYERLFDLTAKKGAVLWLYRHGERPSLVVKV
jgi:hypothetical protein